MAPLSLCPHDFMISKFSFIVSHFPCSAKPPMMVKVLQLMEAEGIEPNLVMLNVLINAFGVARKHMEALSIYHLMKENVGFLYCNMYCYSQ